MDPDIEDVEVNTPAVILAAWLETLDEAALSEGDHSWVVTALKQLLAAAGEKVDNDSVEYDAALVALVGPTFDGAAGRALLARF